MGEDVDTMRNLFYFTCVVLLLAAGAGCGGGLGKPETVTLETPLPDYQPQQTGLTPEQRYVGPAKCKHQLHPAGLSIVFIQKGYLAEII
jgi:hypothetical protein